MFVSDMENKRGNPFKINSQSLDIFEQWGILLWTGKFSTYTMITHCMNNPEGATCNLTYSVEIRNCYLKINCQNTFKCFDLNGSDILRSTFFWHAGINYHVNDGNRHQSCDKSALFPGNISRIENAVPVTLSSKVTK